MFANRATAGVKLAEKLKKIKFTNPLILALPRGGVPVGFEIAKRLKTPLEVIVARKIGSPNNPELGVGAISEEGNIVLDRGLIGFLGISDLELRKIITSENEELQRRINLYRKGKKIGGLSKFEVILVDDGLATGGTAKAAVKFIKTKKPKKLIFASPIGSREIVESIKKMVDDIVILDIADGLGSIGAWYRDFKQLTDKEVLEILKRR
ncbi:phosphoribosyltransferase [Candidatus Daviesbacteria bacterium]|nr:phosphoribosyltransferase [Candidatus Daviesbacteria bacterium]